MKNKLLTILAFPFKWLGILLIIVGLVPLFLAIMIKLDADKLEELMESIEKLTKSIEVKLNKENK